MSSGIVHVSAATRRCSTLSVNAPVSPESLPSTAIRSRRLVAGAIGPKLWTHTRLATSLPGARSPSQPMPHGDAGSQSTSTPRSVSATLPIVSITKSLVVVTSSA